jgi:hypothetical protein
VSLIAATVAGVLAYKAGRGGVPGETYLTGCDVLGADLPPPAPVTVVVQQQPLSWAQSWLAGLTAGLTVAVITHYWRQV